MGTKRMGRHCCLFAVLIGMTLGPASLTAQWPEFRGPTGQGLGGAEELPLRWSESSNIQWKSTVPGLGWSSPVVRGDSVWLTTSTEGGQSLRAIRLDAATGKIEKDVEVFRLAAAAEKNDKNSHASPTPILEENRVYLHFGAQGTAALDGEGAILWRNQEHTYNPMHGTGGSPAVAGDLLIFNCDGNDVQFVAALNKHTGKTVWRKARGVVREGYLMSFSTPLLIPGPDGDQVVSAGTDRAISYDAKTGQEIWWITYDGYSVVPRPVYGDGLVYLMTGFHGPTLFAVHADGRGDLTGTEKVAWKFARSVSLTPSPLLVGEEIYMVSDNGIATCLDARTGEQIWQSRLNSGYSASPIHSNGRIYFLSEDGETTVVRAGRKFKRLATNQIEGRTLASLAAVEGSIYLRSDTALYRIADSR